MAGKKKHTIDFVVETASFNQLLIILVDKLDNIRSINYDYKIFGDNIWARFNAGKAEQQWYYHSLLNAFKVRKYHPLEAYHDLLKEFEHEVHKIF